jgi:hypothetical protein
LYPSERVLRVIPLSVVDDRATRIVCTAVAKPEIRGMKCLLPFAFLLFGHSLAAQDSGFGLGIMLGDPTGITGKGWIGGDKAIDFGVAWNFAYSGSFHLHADYLFHNMDLITVGKGRLPLYYGPGIRIRAWGDNGYYRHGRYYDYNGSYTQIGARIPVGLAYLFDGAPVDVFVEIAPTLNLIPNMYLDFDAAIGARYWF